VALGELEPAVEPHPTVADRASPAGRAQIDGLVHNPREIGRAGALIARVT
jgi:hypothetical protein